MQSNLKSVDVLPVLNLTDSFIITKEAKKTLKEDWLAYIDLVQDKAFAKISTFETVKKIAKERKPYSEMSERTRRIFGFEGKLKVVNHMSKQRNYQTSSGMAYSSLVNFFYGENIKDSTGMYLRAIIDRFFAYQWSHEKLLYPLDNKPGDYRRAQNWSDFIEKTPMFKLADEAYTILEKNKISKNALYNIFSSTSWRTIESVQEKDLQNMHSFILDFSTKKDINPYHNTRVINEVRRILIEQGRKGIKTPTEAITERKGGYHDIEKLKSISFIDRDMFFIDNSIMSQKAREHIVTLADEGLGINSLRKTVAAMGIFFKYLSKYHAMVSINSELVDEMFDPSYDNTLFLYLIELQGSKDGASKQLNMIIPFLVSCELYSAKARKNTPSVRKKVKALPYRAAMPRDMVLHLIDILTTRPPLSPTKWRKNKADTSWWAHDVYPIFPLMMLFHYYIPIRGAQVRNLCRENSFTFENNGDISTFIINTDKNVNRPYLQEVPCVWDELQIFVPFLKWHKEYFPHIPKVIYNEDENSPWQDIVPLMTTPLSLRPMAQGTHLDYHKRLLCKYQLEIIEIAQKNGDKVYPKVAWNKKNKPFFKNLEELKTATVKKIDEIEVIYDIHSIRVTGATRYLEAGVGMKVVMELTGHMSAETLTRIYIQLTKKEKSIKLKTAVDKLFMGDKGTLIENGQRFVSGELTTAFEQGSEDMEGALENNGLFSLFRKAYSTNEKKILQLGVEIALERHPSGWFPMIHGICPGVKCPEGREKKCSLCPFLITGKLFMEGVVHQSNLAFARFQREALEMQNDDNKGYKNQMRAEGLETMLEEILGWNEIMQKIEKDMEEKESDNNLSISGNLKSLDGEQSGIFALKAMETDLAYLSNAYDARLIGVEQDRHSLKILTIKAMKIAAKMGNMELLDEVSEDENMAIDHLMSYYDDRVTTINDSKNLIDLIGKLPPGHKSIK